MTLSEGKYTLADFHRFVHEADMIEPLVGRFEKLCKAGNRKGMIELIMRIPRVTQTNVSSWYNGKNDAQALQLYEKSLRIVTEGGSKAEEESRACDVLTEALFAASASSVVFLHALAERANRWYNVKAFTKCMKDCRCMLTLPASFYDGSADIASHFVECRKQCLYLEHECVKKLEASFRKKKSHGKNSKPYDFSSCGMLTEKHAVVIPHVEGRPHRSLTCCSNAVSLQFDERRGRHLVADRNIKAGSILMVDQPFSFSTDREAFGRNCLHCHTSLKLENAVRIPCRNCRTVSFCSEDCRGKAWQLYHRYECSVLTHFFERGFGQGHRQTSSLLLAYRTTVREALSSNASQFSDDTKLISDISVFNSEFLQYHCVDDTTNAEDQNMSNDVNKLSLKIGTNDKYDPLDYRTVLQLETHCADAETNINLAQTVEAIFLTKCLIFILSEAEISFSDKEVVALAVGMLHHLQAINCNAYEIVENVRDEKTHVWEPRFIGGAIYPTVSLVNHSCYPNVVRHSYPAGIVVVRALRFISKNTEILDCYGPHFLSEERSARREYLWKKYRFLCTCDACKHNWQRPLSEMTNYKCRACSTPFDALQMTESNKITLQCSQCHVRTDCTKMEKQFRKSVEKRLNAIAKMHRGLYEQALSLLLEHAESIEKYIAFPNIEIIKTQQCIIQCYNSFSCISV